MLDVDLCTQHHVVHMYRNLHLITLGGGSSQGQRPVGHLTVGIAGQVGSQSKTDQTGSWG